MLDVMTSGELQSKGAATAAAHPNLALVKYWGQADAKLNLPTNNSISLNLSAATTVTSVVFDPALSADEVVLNDTPADAVTYRRVTQHLDRVRTLAAATTQARVISHNDFPASAGVASSASAFAALSLAATQAMGLQLSTRALSALARTGSGSACRSIPDGFVEWVAGTDDASSYAYPLFPCDHWDLRVMTVTFPEATKMVSSLEGHRAAPTSPFYRARLQEVHHTLVTVRNALQRRDFAMLGMAVEREAMSLHAVAMTSRSPEHLAMSGIYYWRQETMALIRQVQLWRAGGLPLYLTLDAGATVHLLCEAARLDEVQAAVAPWLVELNAAAMVSRPGRGAWLVTENDGAAAPSDPSCRL